jgi:RNA polymerase sigma factor (sigma-70 family)
MASGTLGSGLKHLSDLFGSGTAVGLSDGELLRRYGTSRDASAFEGLVARHGPMVAATCLAVLRNRHDAEDAFQATFLVLARKAGSIRAPDALGGWLHRVAHRAAVQLKVETERRQRHEAEASEMAIPEAAHPAVDFEARSILHEEIDRLPDLQRLAVVLCDLEGLTYDQAAGLLRCTVPTLYHRLANGRKRLRDRVIRRGVTGAAAGAAFESSQASAMAAVPAGWIQAVVAAATGGPTSTTVAALTAILIQSTIMSRIATASAAVFATAALASVVAVAVRPGPRIASVPASHAPIARALPTATDEPNPAAKPGDREVRENRDNAHPKRGALRVARLQHAGDWNVAPQAVPNLMEALRKEPFRFDVVLTPKNLFANEPNLVFYPLVYLHGRGVFSFTNEELDALRRHLDPGGGTLFADATCGSPAFDRAFRHFVGHLLPNHKLEPIPLSDEIYHLPGGSDLRDCHYSKPAGGAKDYPQLEGVKVNGHWAVIYSRFGVSCALDRHSEVECKGYTYESAVRIMGNIVIDSTLP